MYAATEIAMYCILGYFECAWSLNCDPPTLVLFEGILCNGPGPGLDVYAAIAVIMNLIPGNTKSVYGFIVYSAITVTVDVVVLDCYWSSSDNSDAAKKVIPNGTLLNGVGRSWIVYIYSAHIV